MTNRMNLSMEEIIETLEVNFLETKTRNWSKPEKAYETRGSKEALPIFLKLEPNKLIMKTIMKKKCAKNTNLKFDADS